MTTWIALLRGINVAGHRKVPMARLRPLHEELGHTDVVTYIQSGNVVFDAESDAASLTTALEAAVARTFGFEVPVVVRTAAELRTAADGNPFPGNGADPQRVATAFLDAVPASESGRCLRSRGDGREVHLFCPSGFGRTKLTNSSLERRLGVAATSRNWRTIIKLLELSDRD